MIRFEVFLRGQQDLIARLDRMPPAVHELLVRKIRVLALRLQAHIQRDKLSGQVLKVRTGALRRSIFQMVFESATRVIGRVYSSGDVKYARIHELGGRTSPHIIRPRKAQALHFMMGGRGVFAKEVHHPGSLMPERSFMRSGLADMAAEINSGMKEAVISGLLRTQGGRA